MLSQISTMTSKIRSHDCRIKMNLQFKSFNLNLQFESHLHFSGSRCAGCAAAHLIFASFLSEDLSFGPKKLDFHTCLPTQCLEASTGPAFSDNLHWMLYSIFTDISLKTTSTQIPTSKVTNLQSLPQNSCEMSDKMHEQNSAELRY